MKITRRLYLLGILIMCAVAASFVIFFAITNNSIVINNTEVTVEIASTSEQKTRGLCCRDSLPKNSGMLFVYDKPGNHRFWMKDTRIPLDMFWISSEKKIVHIEKSVKPETYPKTFGTNKPAQYILETNAGFAKTHNIKVGDSVTF